MYEICKNVILVGRYELSVMLRKIDTLWLQGQLSDQQKTELEQLARDHADPVMSVNVLKQLEDHETRLRAIEEALKSGQPAPGPTEEYPEYQLHHAYRTGDKVTFEGKHYICKLPEHTTETTWSPKDYPPYWQAV